MTLRLHYAATRRRPATSCSGSGCTRSTGQHVTGPNTKDAGLQFDVRRGTGTVDLEIDRLMLLAGTYDADRGRRLLAASTHSTTSTARCASTCAPESRRSASASWPRRDLDVEEGADERAPLRDD